jgi:hypothetical protein
MSVGSVGSISFWQQDQNYWTQAQQNDQTQSESTTVISQMFNATANLSNGLSSIANQTALSRVNNALTAAVQSALQSETGSATSSASSSSSSSTASSSSSSSSTSSSSIPPVAAAPASGTGTVPLTTNTSLFTLGILRHGSISVSDGTNTTNYTSTGTDTVGDLINAINANAYGNANVAAGLNGSGQLVITSKDDTDTVTIGGTYAPNIGFGAGNQAFSPTTPPSSASTSSGSAGTSSSSSPSTSSSSSGASTSSASTSTSTSSGIPVNSAFALQTSGTAELLLAGNGLAGSLLDLLA